MDALEQKTEKAIHLYESLVKNVNRSFEDKNKEFNQTIITPKF
jgi:hypothetical protein